MFTDPESELIRLQFIGGSRDSETKLKLLEAREANDNLTVEEMLQLIQHRSQAHSFPETSLHQFISSVDAYAEKMAPVV